MTGLELRDFSPEDVAAASRLLAARHTWQRAHALAWANTGGYRAMTIDWRITNLLASRFLPCRNFRPTFYRLYRAVP